MTLYIIGLGLNDKKDISVKGLEAKHGTSGKEPAYVHSIFKILEGVINRAISP